MHTAHDDKVSFLLLDMVFKISAKLKHFFTVKVWSTRMSNALLSGLVVVNPPTSDFLLGFFEVQEKYGESRLDSLLLSH